MAGRGEVTKAFLSAYLKGRTAFETSGDAAQNPYPDHRTYLVISALTHWRSLLVPGGILRLAVPDFDSIVGHYVASGQDLHALLGLLYGGQDNMMDSHHIVFNQDLLHEYLKRVGFKTIRHWEWQETDHAEFDDFSQAYLPHLSKKDGRHMSLNLEGVK